MKKRRGLVLVMSMILVLQLAVPLGARAVAEDFVPSPKTAYATSFMAKCGGQQWLRSHGPVGILHLWQTAPAVPSAMHIVVTTSHLSPTPMGAS